MKILVINGPNINMLGIREPEIYGNKSYLDLCNEINDYASKNNIDVTLFQSNYEGKIVTEIQKAYKVYDGIIINAAAYTHTSIAIADAIAAVGIKTVEVHISDLSKREDYRQVSYLRKYCVACISGLGFLGYIKAMEILLNK